MDELGEITDYMYEAASEDALIIRGLSQDENLGENISVTVIATGFEANSIFQPYKAKKQKKVEMLENAGLVPPKIIPERTEESFSVHEKGKHTSIIADFEEEMQGEINFNLSQAEDNAAMRDRNRENEDDEHEKPEATLRKVKHMQNILKKEGLSNKTMKENIDTFEDVPAYIRRNMSVGTPENASESKLSKFTLTSDDDEGPVLRENNAYLNDNVD
jgi:cell division protein FtsZ